MPNMKMSADERVQHWNKRAEEVRLKALRNEIVQVLKDHPQHLAAVASKLRSMGVSFKADSQSSATAADSMSTPPKAVPKGDFLKVGGSLEEAKFQELKKIVLRLDPRYCNEVHLKTCKEGKARDVNKEGLLRLLELVTDLRRTFIVTEGLRSESDFMAYVQDQYNLRGRRLRHVRLPIDYNEAGAHYITKAKGGPVVRSIACDTVVSLKSLPVPKAEKLAWRFEENWSTKHAVLVSATGERVECRTLFPEAVAPLSIEDGDASDSPEPAPKRRRATVGRPLAVADAPPARAIADGTAGLGDESDDDPEDEGDNAGESDTHQSMVDESTMAPPPPPPPPAARQGNRAAPSSSSAGAQLAVGAGAADAQPADAEVSADPFE